MKPMLAALLTILLGASFSLLSAQEQTPRRSSASIEGNNRIVPDDPTILAGRAGTAAATPAGIVPPPAGNPGCCNNCHPQGCILRKLWIWATYCPKERACSPTPFCNSCQYKGAVPFYLFYLNPKCFEGSGIYPTFPNQCYRGCQGCAAGTAAGHP